MFNRFFSWVRNHNVRKDVTEILHLPLMERLLHVKARRPLIGIALGILIMLVGSTIASLAHVVNEHYGVPAPVVDTGGYFLHAVGALPCLRYLDPMWTLLIGAAEVAE